MAVCAIDPVAGVCSWSVAHGLEYSGQVTAHSEIRAAERNGPAAGELARPKALYFLGGLIMMCAPAVPGAISHGALSLAFVDSPVDWGVAKGR